MKIITNQKHCGFTLIELVVVLAIISMVMLLVLPRLPSSSSENLKSSARILASTLRYVQERAATSRTNYILKIEPGTGIFNIMLVGTDGGEKTPTDTLLQKNPLKDGIIVVDVVIPRLGKLTDGRFSTSVGMGGLRDFVTIHLQSSEGLFWTVMAFPTNGKVKVYDGYQVEVL